MEPLADFNVVAAALWAGTLLPLPAAHPDKARQIVIRQVMRLIPRSFQVLQFRIPVPQYSIPVKCLRPAPQPERATASAT
jgi:hypothetical protein